MSLQSSHKKQDELLKLLDITIERGAGIDSLVLLSMVPFFSQHQNKKADAVMSFAEFCEEISCEKAHLAYRFAAWADYVMGYSGIQKPDFFALECFKNLKFKMQGFFPMLLPGTGEFSEKCWVNAHIGQYTDLNFINDSIVRHKALDWELPSGKKLPKFGATSSSLTWTACRGKLKKEDAVKVKGPIERQIQWLTEKFKVF